ncbi:MAG: hypothetical protein OIF47_07800, partial [Marinibacterium sp.]|nr:hypothetical protein [Marinibacterium sp.]
ALFAPLLLLLAACDTPQAPSGVADAILEVISRNVAVPSYPKGGNTYLSFSHAHGFQVNYLATDGTGSLWYPGRAKAVPETWRLDRSRDALCWTHPPSSSNPVTKQKGGTEHCERMFVASRTVIASLKGDPFDLASGEVPYRLDKCTAPDAFQFDRKRYACR